MAISAARTEIFLTQTCVESANQEPLENELGQCLLKREAHSIRLTPTGEMLRAKRVNFFNVPTRCWTSVRPPAKACGARWLAHHRLPAASCPQAWRILPRSTPNARVGIVRPLTRKCWLDWKKTTTWMPCSRSAWTAMAHGFKGRAHTRFMAIAVNRHHPLARKARVTPAEVALGPLLVFWPARLPGVLEYRHRMVAANIANAPPSPENMMCEQSVGGCGIGAGALPSSRTARARLSRSTSAEKQMSAAPKPLCIAAGHRASRAAEKQLAVFIENCATRLVPCVSSTRQGCAVRRSPFMV